MWFAFEPPPLLPPKLEGRIVTVDGRCRAQYTITGIARRNAIELAPDLTAGTTRLLLHTHIEHSKVDRHEMPMASVVVSRCWHTLINRNHTDIVCRGCGTPSPICALCLSAVSSCCISADPISTLDVMAALRLDDVTSHCRSMSTPTYTLLWEIRSHRDEVFCLLRNAWLSRRDEAS